MRTIWQIVGTTLYWLSSPALAIYLYFTNRTRVLVISGSEVLVLKGWFSDGRIGLPGGGLHAGENSETGVLRELLEETGIRAEPRQLKKLFTRRISRRPLHNFTVHAFALELPGRPALTRRKREISHIEWLEYRVLLARSDTAPSLRAVLDAWRDDG